MLYGYQKISIVRTCTIYRIRWGHNYVTCRWWWKAVPHWVWVL